MPTKPAKFPEFAVDNIVDPQLGTPNVIEPPAEKKLAGWLYKEFPPNAWFNWLHRLTYQWLEYLDSLHLSGRVTTEGGAVTEQFSIAGITADDHIIAHLHTGGASPVTILSAKTITDGFEVTFSADPSTDHVLTYQIMRSEI